MDADGDRLLLDLAAGQTQTPQVLFLGLGSEPIPAARNLTHLVRAMLELVDSGEVVWDGASGWWRFGDLQFVHNFMGIAAW